MNDDGIEDRRMLRERELQLEYGLSIRESEVVAAREDGLTNVEIARLMGITRQSVNNVLSKARAKGVRLDEGRDQGR
jgi:DNA-binding CsgD family transcriptional regulator